VTLPSNLPGNLIAVGASLAGLSIPRIIDAFVWSAST